MYKDKLFNLAKNLSKTGNFSEARRMVKLAVSREESPDEIFKSYEQRRDKLKERDIESNLTINDIKVILSLIDDQINYMTGSENKPGFNARSARCSYCDAPIITRDNISLDRVDNSQGYILGNLVFACSECNMFKGQYYLNDYIENAVNVAKNLKSTSLGRKKILEDARKLKETVTDYMNVKIEDGYTMLTHPEAERALSQRMHTSGRDRATYIANIDKILGALGRSLNVAGSSSVENIIQATSNILNRENRSLRLDWSYQKIREFIFKHFEDLKKEAGETNNQDAMFVLEYIESELDDREGESEIAVKRPEAKLLTLIRNSNKVSGILSPLKDGPVENIQTLISQIRNDLKAPYINTWDVKNFIIQKLSSSFRKNFYISILKSKRDTIKSKITEGKEFGYESAYIITNIHRSILANSEGGREIVRDFINGDSELSSLINRPVQPQP